LEEQATPAVEHLQADGLEVDALGLEVVVDAVEVGAEGVGEGGALRD
jgi:hypothetical protein